MNITKNFGAKEMIDITRMRTLYSHLEKNPEIEAIIQTPDNNEPLLAEIGQVMMEGDVEAFKKYVEDGRVKMIQGKPIPETNAVYCLYIPPYYVFTDLKRLYA